MQVSIIQSFDYNRTIHWINGVETAKQNFQIKINSYVFFSSKRRSFLLNLVLRMKEQYLPPPFATNFLSEILAPPEIVRFVVTFVELSSTLFRTISEIRLAAAAVLLPEMKFVDVEFRTKMSATLSRLSLCRSSTCSGFKSATLKRGFARGLLGSPRGKMGK